MRHTLFLFVIGTTLAVVRHAHAGQEEITVALPEAGTEVQLGKQPIQITTTIDAAMLKDECRGPCMYKCVVIQGDPSEDGKQWESKPVDEPSCSFPVKDQATFQEGEAHIAVYFAEASRARVVLGPGVVNPWFMPGGNKVTFSGGRRAPHSPMEKFVAKRSTLLGPKAGTATSLGSAIKYREYNDRARRWKPLSTALAKIRRGLPGKPASWDAAYGDVWSNPDSGGGVSCPDKDEKSIKVQGGMLSFPVVVGGESTGKRGGAASKVVAVKVPIEASGAIQKTIAIPGAGDMVVSGVIENEDAVYERDQVRFGRSVTVQVTPKDSTDDGCAFHATAPDYLESRRCVPRHEAITGSAVVQSGFNSMERCCRGLKANDKKEECE
jgi:hypothetical protein